MKLKEFDFSLDIKRHKRTEDIILVQNDRQTTKFNINLMDGNHAFLIGENAEISIVFQKSDDTYIEQECEFIGNKVSVILVDQVLTKSGKVIAEIIIRSDNQVLTTTSFDFHVRKNILNDNAIESTNEIGILNKLIDTVKELIQKVINSIPRIGDNGNWFIGDEDTGKPSRGPKGDKGDKGEQGPKGEKGDKGDRGIDGIGAVHSVNDQVGDVKMGLQEVWKQGSSIEKDEFATYIYGGEITIRNNEENKEARVGYDEISILDRIDPVDSSGSVGRYGLFIAPYDIRLERGNLVGTLSFNAISESRLWILPDQSGFIALKEDLDSKLDKSGGVMAGALDLDSNILKRAILDEIHYSSRNVTTDEGTTLNLTSDKNYYSLDLNEDINIVVKDFSQEGTVIEQTLFFIQPNTPRNVKFTIDKGNCFWKNGDSEKLLKVANSIQQVKVIRTEYFVLLEHVGSYPM